MPTPAALENLRCTAALLSATPTISARLSHDEHVVLEVRRPPHPARDHAVLPPCWFRALVADIAGHGEPGNDDDRRRLETLARCRVELGVRAGTSVLPASVVRVYGGTAWLHLLAVASPLEDVKPIACEAFDAAEGIDPEVPFELHAARDLGVTVLGLASPRTAAESELAADLLRAIGMRIAIDRLERGLGDGRDGAASWSSAHRPDR